MFASNKIVFKKSIAVFIIADEKTLLSLCTYYNK
jgi:hypothetical protein